MTNEKRSRCREKIPVKGVHVMKVEIVAVNLVRYGRMKAAGRRPSLPVKFRHGGVRMWFCEWPFFCGKTWHENKELRTYNTGNPVIVMHVRGVTLAKAAAKVPQPFSNVS